MPEAYLVGGVRTPVGRYGGTLSAVRPDDLAALVVGEAVRRAGLDPARTELDEVILGAANQAGEDNRNVARMAVLLAGLPDTVPGITVNRLCASGMSAVTMAAQAIRAGDADLLVAGGVESMTRAPWVQAKPEKAWAKPGAAFDTSIGWRFPNPRLAARDKATFTMPETAEEVASVDGITRAEADAFAVRSQQRAAAAIAAGRFVPEIVGVPVRDGEVLVDEGPRPDTTLEVLARLRPVVAGGEVVTAGNSSALNDGASAVLVASAEAVERHGLTPRARIVVGTSAALAPEIMGLGPVPATEKALRRSGLSLDDIGAVELNEAFASQSLACIRRLGLDEDRVNADGGAIALGHPLGSSGSRLLVTLMGRMEREDSRYGLATMCVGVGQGAAVILEKV
ncbi:MULTISPECIES: acetyl-CoA C-acyltransferase [unclassified Microbacterium]|uniref:thiolase family protein n=1 Tax=unclassified Microbacterium TaxID=2609290 RepID=UPI0024689F9F|nr:MULTISPECIES: acetyl-CoA C-acyltransferase [unclassified Microbacterium]MDH5134957.1 acetyl-CoA C-acyltransferase [Microbacterium sp. RD10]MDH5138451.1 acetyl-CoA C-acyltransferase [Microbacterium sp. RD11]MDH5145325.1 acetyl-CoA C-acyltransferase [Microbacterium sp. RD12]MDH5156533.1 acetyl-CoA C-acyltransferase [Microbacterium sp. RD06]MDH5167796.1 acetyl-CoA C-acyltransferase [Microbacterium sp. RD02]